MPATNEEALKEILEQSLAGYWDWDISTGNEYLSPSFKRMFGYEDHEIENRSDSWQKLIFKEDLPGVFEKFNRHAESKGEIPFYNEVRYHHRNGSTVWVICTGKVIEWDENGKAKRMVGCHIDISVRKQMETELLKTSTMVESLLDAIPDVIGVQDLEHGMIRYNAAGYALLGKTPEDIAGKKCFEVLGHKTACATCATVESYCTKKPARVEKFVPELGVWLDARSYPVLDSHGEIRFVIEHLRDITKSKQAEDALQKSEEKYRTLVETTSTGYVFIDEHGLVLDANDEYVRLTGHGKLEEILGRNVIEWTSEADREKNATAVKSCFQKGYIRHFETRYVDKTGNVTPIEINATCLSVAGKVQIITLCRDITDRKRTEELLSNAQKLESLGVLAGGIAHDFNNLMSGVFGYIDIASRASTESMVKKDLDKVMQTIGRARALTQQLLTFAKGGFPVQEVSPLVPFIQETARFALSGSNAACRFDIPDGLWSANFDKNQIGQVIDNLVINALQAMPLGGTIVLSARNIALADNEHPLLKSGDYVKLSVIDAGIGIPKDLQKRIFDPFFTTKAKGHGLGLATCYSIINRHGGCIDVFSEPGKGSTFNVYLPAVRELAPGSNEVIKKAHKGSGTFLVMDDEEIVRQAVSYLLGMFGYNVVCKVNGQEAIDYVASAVRDHQPLAGMLFDLTVPGAMGGKEAIKEIRKMGLQAPAFVSSGYADDPVIRNPAEYGFTASICKPFIIDELSDMLNNFMAPVVSGENFSCPSTGSMSV